MATSKPKPGDRKLVAANRRARRNYEILETVEAGIVLRGSEVKSFRDAQVQLADAYVRFDGGEAWLQSMHVAPYLHAQEHSGHDPDRHRKLLLHRKEIDRLKMRMDLDRLSLIPLEVYFRDGKVKVELGLGKPLNTIDKRQVIAERDADREARRALAHRSR